MIDYSLHPHFQHIEFGITTLPTYRVPIVIGQVPCLADFIIYLNEITRSP